MSIPLLLLKVRAATVVSVGTLSPKYLDSLIAKRVENFAKEACPRGKEPEAYSLDIVTGGGKTFHTGQASRVAAHIPMRGGREIGQTTEKTTVSSAKQRDFAE
jgi:hypothetical protein